MPGRLVCEGEMKDATKLFYLATALSLVLNACGPSSSPTATAVPPTPTLVSIPNRKDLTLQEQSSAPHTLLETKPSDGLEDNHLGGIWSDFWQPMDFQFTIDHEIVPMGLKRARITINEGEFFTNTESGLSIDWSKPELSIPPEFDNYVTELIAHKVTVDYVLTFWDKANHPNGWNVPARFQTEEEVARYLEYVHFIVSHFKGRVQYYELWNEPENGVPLQYIEPSDYIELARRTIPVIHEIDPEARVIVGGVSWTAEPNRRNYLFALLDSEVMTLADGVSWHPLYGDTPDAGQYPDYYASYPSLLAEIIRKAKQNGFRGEFIADEISYRGPGCGGCNITDPSFSNIIAGKYTARGIILHLGNNVAAGVGGIAAARTVHYNTLRNIANVFAGANASAFKVDVQTEAKNFKVFTFTKTDGSRLIALWTDGIAVDNDYGVPFSIVIPEFGGWNATGIDILKGLEQELTTSNENGNLNIRGLLIRDYPIIIRMSK